jgi:hypothetical protein
VVVVAQAYRRNEDEIGLQSMAQMTIIPISRQSFESSTSAKKQRSNGGGEEARTIAKCVTWVPAGAVRVRSTGEERQE